MIRNYHLIIPSLVWHNHQCFITTKCALGAKQLQYSADKQSRIMQKLFGERIKGSKKRWYPDKNEGGSNVSTTFKASQFGKPTKGNGKNNLRRMAVLNKLFIKHITDLLATGEVSEQILGRGLQITRVKISPDYAGISVYWTGTNDPIKDADLETELHRCSGPLRHELSQLRLMGEVPRLHFLRDRKYENLTKVNELIKHLDLSDTDDDDSYRSHYQDVELLKDELYGVQSDPQFMTKAELENLPKLRHDVFGLDHKSITLNILTKMKKSKLAWEMHYNPELRTKVPDIHIKIQNIQSETVDEKEQRKFQKFLENQWSRKNTPERKKYDRYNEVISLDDEAAVDEAPILSDRLKSLYDEVDSIYEDPDSHKK